MKLFFFTILISVCLFSCKTDFDVNAPYDQVPIVYGLLDQSVDTHYIKINRTYLGANNLNSANINDSILFKNVNARIEQVTNGAVGTVYTLQEKWVNNINEGIFYPDSQKVYFFVEPNLDANSTYRLAVTADGKEFGSETTLLGNYSFTTSTILSTLNGFPFASAPGVYSTIDPKWTTTLDGIRYDLALRFFYDEHKGANITRKSIDWFLGSDKKPSPTSFVELQREVNGESFYIFLSNQEALMDTVGVTKRVIRNVQLMVTAADNELTTYIDVNKPVTGVVTERPEYTNITNGFGIFSARRTIQLNRALNQKSVQELAEGQYTRDLKFCTDSVDWIGESYHCP